MKGFRRPLDLCFWLGVALALGGALWILRPIPNRDPQYYARVRNQAFRRGPSVLFDEAHWNAASVHGNYEPFVQLIRRDGYRVFRNRQDFVPELLAAYDILVIVDPAGFRGEPFTSDEVRAVNAWVRDGGKLLLASRSGPARLTTSFGVHIKDAAIESSEPAIHDHPIVHGRTDYDESLRRLAFFGGQTFSAPPAFLGAQAIAAEFGKGRLVVVGDSSALTAQLVNRQRRGINNANFDNHQLVLNIMHWLSRLI